MADCSPWIRTDTACILIFYFSYSRFWSLVQSITAEVEPPIPSNLMLLRGQRGSLILAAHHCRKGAELFFPILFDTTLEASI